MEDTVDTISLRMTRHRPDDDSDLDYVIPHRRRTSHHRGADGALRVTAQQSEGSAAEATCSFLSFGDSRPTGGAADGRVSIVDANSSVASTSSEISRSAEINSVCALPAGWPSTLECRQGIGSSSSIQKDLGVIESDALVSDEVLDHLSFEHLDRSVYQKPNEQKPRCARRLSRLDNIALHQLCELSQPKFLSLTSFMLNPTGAGWLMFDFVGVGVLFGDLTLVPYLLACDVENTLPLSVLSIITAAFWTFDIFVNFLIGFTNHGDLELSPIAVAKNYMAAWFFMDALLVCSNWVTILFSSMTSSVKMARFAKMGRFLRIIGLVRMVRLTRVSESLGYRGLSEGYRLVVNVGTILLGILWRSHLIACAWYLLGRRADSDTGVTWIDGAPFDELDYNGLLYQYTTAVLVQ